MAYRHHNQIQGGIAASGYANTSVVQSADQDLAGEAIDAIYNLIKVTAVDRVIVALFTDAN
jgi:hypothetical protein